MAKTVQEGAAPTWLQIHSDKITSLAKKYWAPSTESKAPFDSEIVEEIYKTELLGSGFLSRRAMYLEYSQYLERFLWPNFGCEGVPKPHLMSIVCMVNEKYRERVPPWQAFLSDSKNFSNFLDAVLRLSLDESLPMKEQCQILVFLIHTFNSLQIDLIRNHIQKFVSFPIWENVLPSRREEILKRNEKLKKYWSLLQRKDAKMLESQRERAKFERGFLALHIDKYLSVLAAVTFRDDRDNLNRLSYCERFIEWMIDLEAQLPTRRFFWLLVDDKLVVVKSQLAQLHKHAHGQLFTQLLEMLKFYAGFEINELTGEALTAKEVTSAHYAKIQQLQRVVFKHCSELRHFAVSHVAGIDTKKSLKRNLKLVSDQDLLKICFLLNLMPERQGSLKNSERKVLLEMLVGHFERRPSQLESLNSLPLYPTEDIIWNESIVPVDYYNGDACLALPKLHLQFLTLHDYLLRNFNLFRLESTYEIRQDIEDCIVRMKPWRNEVGDCHFGGWARMGQPITAFSVVEVGKPNIGEDHPSVVRADVSIDLHLKPQIKFEWEGLRKHDVAFLVCVRPVQSLGSRYDFKGEFIPQVGLVYVRGCEIEGILDENGQVVEETFEPRKPMPGHSRTYRVWLDPNQYQLDMTKTSDGHEDIYGSFNVIIRRKPKENNFKAVLETIRELLNMSCVVPQWLHDILLGYGDPGAAHYSHMPNQVETLDWNDTFLDLGHLRQSFPNHDVKLVEGVASEDPPFRLTIPTKLAEKRSADRTTKDSKRTILVKPYKIPNRGPYGYNNPKRNAIPFTPTQIEAVKAGMQPGLTMVVGPPGTGKTDVAVQIISNLYHNYPDQRTLIVTHSNQALNQLFEKIMALDIEERHMLRMGHGEETLETEKDFSRYGRVNYVLAHRLELLEEVARLQRSLEIAGQPDFTCESAGYFFLCHVLSRWEKFHKDVHDCADKTLSAISQKFPFLKFFENAPQPLFKGFSKDEDFEIAEGCFRHIRKMFVQLEEYRAFELLRSGQDRTRYLLVKEAKIIAMTCTHAALKRHDLVDMDFQYDNILMEESAQILEIETFIPLLLQNPKDGHNRLKRWIMIGDHHQLPPVIKNMAFQKFSNMEQSLFSRFVQLGVPTIDLDSQGRARAELCELYRWRYKKLGNLSHVIQHGEYQSRNPGFRFNYQLINVEDFNGVGETEPNPHFIQNLSEAEFVVAVYMYMRVLGYPSGKISILTTYNGQKHLIRDVLQQRCASHPYLGLPSKVTTVDRFQGQQNDYILLSLVRTKIVGHLRDVRRLIVAMSRARLGLYIFGRVELFQNCFELTPVFSKLIARPVKLSILPNEEFPLANPNPGQPLELQSMQHCTEFVYRFVMDRVLSRQRDSAKTSGEEAP